MFVNFKHNVAQPPETEDRNVPQRKMRIQNNKSNLKTSIWLRNFTVNNLSLHKLNDGTYRE